MKQRIYKPLLLVILTMAGLSASAYDCVVDGIYFNLVYDKATVTHGDDKYEGSIVIPSSITYNDKNYSVTDIGGYAFSSCTGLTSITIPNSVTFIGLEAFYYCTGLTSVTIPNSVMYIEKGAFNSCTDLTSITIPNSVNYIGDNLFNNCSGLEQIVVEQGNTAYDSRDNCNAIIETASNTLITGCKNTIIPNSVTSIGNSAFSNCTGLTNITIPNSVTSIGSGAFNSCTGLTSIDIPNSVTNIGNSALHGCTGLTRVNIPNSVTNIGNSAFTLCTGLTSITIPNSVTSIGESAFAACTGLTNISIPNSVTSIGNSVFQGCHSLEQIVIEKGNTAYDSRDNCNAIIETASNTLISGCKNTVIPNSVTSIGDYALQNCIGLTNIDIPNGVFSIGEGALSFCKGLINITIPNSVTTIGFRAFYRCTGLGQIVVEQGNPAYDSRDNCNAIIETASNTLITGCKNTVIPNSVTSIGNDAFYFCTGLTSITIPNCVTSIGTMAFYNCTGLTSVISFIQEPFTISSFVFGSTSATLYVPKGTKEKYEATPAWNQFSTIVEMDDEFNAVDAVCSGAETTEANRYTLGGQRVNGQQKGLNIIRMSDGTTRKVLVK